VPIYHLNDDHLLPLEETTFADAGIREREHLQQVLRDRIETIAPGTLIIGEEFGDWDASRRRIDLLGLDKSGAIVVIELKRTQDGSHMELQALRYAAMVSALTFDDAVQIYQRYLSARGDDADARSALLEFLEWDDEQETEFAQDVRIVLAAAEFSKEVTTTVLWLNDRGLDIRCVRMRPYRDGPRVLLDIQQVIPLPEAQEYQIGIRNKARKELAERSRLPRARLLEAHRASRSHRALVRVGSEHDPLFQHGERHIVSHRLPDRRLRPTAGLVD
jgi:hypothetical protein